MPNTPECIRHEGIPLDHCPSACFRITTVVRDRDSSRSVLASAPISFVLPSCPLERALFFYTNRLATLKPYSHINPTFSVVIP
jgi:hypothetical protein